MCELGPSLSVIGKVASALWGWTARTDNLPKSIDRSSRTRSAGSLRGAAHTKHAHNHRVLSAASIERHLHGNFQDTFQGRVRFSRKRILVNAHGSGVKSTHISR